MAYIKVSGGPTIVISCDGKCNEASFTVERVLTKCTEHKPNKEIEKLNTWCLQRCERCKITLLNHNQLLNTEME